MPPNFNETPGPSPVDFAEKPNNGVSAAAEVAATGNAGLKAVRSLTTLVTHMLIGIVVGVSLLFAFRSGELPLGATNLHIVLCVLGFQFLMAEAMLALAPDSWLSTLNLKHKRWVHWILQVVGSVLALVGCFIKIVDKSNHWSSLHAKYALVSMVFTTVSLVNGVTSLYAYELRKIMPGIYSKLTHICFGIIAMATASISLAYGFHKGYFRTWATDGFTDVLIIMTLVFTAIVCINPFITLTLKTAAAFKKQ